MMMSKSASLDSIMVVLLWCTRVPPYFSFCCPRLVMAQPSVSRRALFQGLQSIVQLLFLLSLVSALNIITAFKFSPSFVKHDGRRKSRLVAGRHVTAKPNDLVYSVVISLRSVRIIAFLAEINGLKLWGLMSHVPRLQISTRFLINLSRPCVQVLLIPIFC